MWLQGQVQVQVQSIIRDFIPDQLCKGETARNNRGLGGYFLPSDAGEDMSAILGSDGSAAGSATLNEKQAVPRVSLQCSGGQD